MILMLAVFLAGCTENDLAKNFGGTMALNVECGQKIVNVTWKNDDLWYLTRAMRTDEQPETLTFKAESSFGVWEGTVLVVESTCK